MGIEQELRTLCEGFVKQHQIRSPESPYQMHGSAAAAVPVLIEDICNLVGYYDDDTGELDRTAHGDPRTPEFGVAR